MKSFSKLYSDFWINYDNSEVVGLGIDAQLMALYLQGNSHHNILGVYYLPLLYISSDLKLSVKKVRTALEKLCKINYCKYDERTQYIWIYNLVFEQIGENVDIKDNRIKALHTIWQVLPSKLEFLEEIYQRYNAAFYLEPRIFEKPPKLYEIKEIEKTTKNELAVTGVSSGTNININAGIPASTNTDTAINFNTNTEIQPSIEPLSLLVAPFEVPSGSFESIDEGGNRNDVFENNILVPPLEPLQVFLGNPLATKTASNTPIIYKAASAGGVNEEIDIALTPSKLLTTPFEGASKPLASPFGGASDPLRSNIEDRSKIIEVRSKKEEIEEELEKEKRRDIHNSRVLTPSIVAHEEKARQGGVEELGNKIFFEEAKAEKTLFASITAASSISVSAPVLVPTPKTEVIPMAELVPVAKLKPKVIKTKNKADASVVAVFEHWKNIMKHPKSNLDRKREILILNALGWGYSVSQLCEAVTGCSYTPHNIGQNDRGQRYDGLHIILRDADQIDRFIHNCHSPPRPCTEAHQRLQANVYVANEWVKKKQDESAFLGMRRNNYD